MEEVKVVQAARAIRPYLTELIDSEEAAAVLDRRLVELLADAQAGMQVGMDLLLVLGERDATREWVAEYLGDEPLPERYRGWGPPGDVGAISTRRWVCPHQDYDWYAPAMDERRRRCPAHGVELVPDDN
jgi:hypothetical protein